MRDDPEKFANRLAWALHDLVVFDGPNHRRDSGEPRPWLAERGLVGCAFCGEEWPCAVQRARTVLAEHEERTLVEEWKRAIAR